MAYYIYLESEDIDHDSLIRKNRISSFWHLPVCTTLVVEASKADQINGEYAGSSHV